MKSFFFVLDEQNCTLEIQSWSRPAEELLVREKPQSVRPQIPYIRTEWEVYKIDVRNQTLKRYLWLIFDVNIRRNHQFYVNHMIFPFSILSCLTLFVFWLPPDSGEKITLTITILLALTVFLQLISNYTPKASSNLPIIGKYKLSRSKARKLKFDFRPIFQRQFNLGAYFCRPYSYRTQFSLSWSEKNTCASLVSSDRHG